MDVLVLSNAWVPVKRVPWQRALTLLYEEKVAPVTHYPNWRVRSASAEWAVPSIIRFLNVQLRRRRSIKFSRENIWLRDHGACQYCGLKVSPDDYEFEHVVPRAQGGKTEWENIVTACTGCNQRKGGRTPAQAGMRLLIVPVKPKSLPVTDGMYLRWKPGMPEEWRDFLRNVLFWRDELEQD